jgi:hypothetical protein
MNRILSSSQYLPPRASSPIFLVYPEKWQEIGLRGVQQPARREGLNWDKIMGLAIMTGVSAAGWAAVGMVIFRLLR